MIGLGVFVFLKNPKQKSNLIFLIFCIAVGWWLLSTFMILKTKTDFEAIFWDRIVYVGVVFIPILMYHFGLIFTDTEKKNKKKLYFGYFGAFTFLVLSRTDYFVNDLYKFNWGVHTQAELFHHFFLAFFILYVFLFLLEIYRFLKKRKKEIVDETKIKQVNYLFTSFIIMNIGAYAFLPAYGININPVGAYWAEIVAVSILAFAILKYHLFEIKVILTELLVGVMGVTLLILPFLMPTTNLRILAATILFLFLIFGYYLIKATHEEEKRKEEAERMAVQERALRLRTERLAGARDQFILSSQHYFRTPLTSIIGYLEMVLEENLYGKLPQKAKEKLNNVSQSVQELRKRIEESLSIVAFQAGKGILNLEETQIEDLVKKAVEDLRILAQKKNLFLKLKLPKDSLPKIKLDKEKITEALTNLIENGIKHTNEGGVTIGLEHKKEKNSVLFWVKDTGIGISKEELPEIGKVPFQRGKEAKELTLLGKGIGLYLSRLIVEAQGGKLWAESEGIGKGSVFYVELPVK